MLYVDLDREWTFRRGMVDSLGALEANEGTVVNLPHDGMIGSKVSPNAPGKYDTGYFAGDLTNYTKYVDIPAEWKNESVGLCIDGAMMNATIDVNGCKVGAQHYGYAPFYVDLTDYVTFGEPNRITVNINTSAWENSRWYTGSGMYRGVKLCHGPRVHVANDGIFLYTKEICDGTAFVGAEVEVVNSTYTNNMVEVVMTLTEDGTYAKTGTDAAGCIDAVVKTVKSVIRVDKASTAVAKLAFALENAKVWNIDTPNLYQVKVSVRDLGEYRTHFIPKEESACAGACGECTVDTASTLWGVRTVTADALRGLRINGETVKLKGGCLHHDNGLLGAVTLYETEARKVRKLKEVGFNAIRTAHNPPSKALVEACDREGMFIFDEAFDAWGMAKRASDYSQFFDACWERDLTAFVKRDRCHPSVIIWSTGNEIPERGGLGDGYTKAFHIAEKIHALDGSRPVSNGVCSMWSGLDDQLAKDKNQAQNAAEEDPESCMWENVTEPFTNGLDIVGYNYYEDGYEKDHEMFPDRVMMGSENFPREIGFRWPLVERLPYVIGDFTWTAWDYLGEAGIGKTLYMAQDDPRASEGPWTIMPPTTSPYPWRCANDADFDITGKMLPQGQYRSIVWGSKQTYVYSKHPDYYGLAERSSLWGFPYVVSNWNYEGYENRPIELMVFTNADEAEVIVNGKSLGRKPVLRERPWPNTVSFDAVYEPGEVVAISYTNGVEVSRDTLVTTTEAASIVLTPEKKVMKADGHDLIYVNISVLDASGRVVPTAEIELTATLSGAATLSDAATHSGAATHSNAATLSGFGSGNPITDEDYTDCVTKTYRGRALAILRAGYEAGEVTFRVAGGGFSDEVTLHVKGDDFSVDY